MVLLSRIRSILAASRIGLKPSQAWEEPSHVGKGPPYDPLMPGKGPFTQPEGIVDRSEPLRSLKMIKGSLQATEGHPMSTEDPFMPGQASINCSKVHPNQPWFFKTGLPDLRRALSGLLRALSDLLKALSGLLRALSDLLRGLSGLLRALSGLLVTCMTW